MPSWVIHFALLCLMVVVSFSESLCNVVFRKLRNVVEADEYNVMGAVRQKRGVHQSLASASVDSSFFMIMCSVMN